LVVMWDELVLRLETGDVWVELDMCGVTQQMWVAEMVSGFVV